MKVRFQMANKVSAEQEMEYAEARHKAMELAASREQEVILCVYDEKIKALVRHVKYSKNGNSKILCDAWIKPPAL